MLKWPPDVHRGIICHICPIAAQYKPDLQSYIIWVKSFFRLSWNLRLAGIASAFVLYINPLRLGVFDVHSPPLLTFHRKLLSSRLQRSPRLKEMQSLQQPSIACFCSFGIFFILARIALHTQTSCSLWSNRVTLAVSLLLRFSMFCVLARNVSKCWRNLLFDDTHETAGPANNAADWLGADDFLPLKIWQSDTISFEHVALALSGGPHFLNLYVRLYASSFQVELLPVFIDSVF